jgi:Trk K+ transport system NAD-binding subunit
LRWEKENLAVRYGDAEDIEFMKSLPLQNAKWILSTIPRFETNQILIASTKENDFQGKIAISIFDKKELHTAKKMGTDLILLPYKDAAAKAAQRLAKSILNEPV